MISLSTELNRLRNANGPLNWRKDNIWDVNKAAEGLGELTLLHLPTGSQIKGRIQISFSNGWRELGGSMNHMTVMELYRRNGFRLNRPQDRLIYIEGAVGTPYPVEMMAVLH